jgi:hypothetical protein
VLSAQIVSTFQTSHSWRSFETRETSPAAQCPRAGTLTICSSDRLWLWFRLIPPRGATGSINWRDAIPWLALLVTTQPRCLSEFAGRLRNFERRSAVPCLPATDAEALICRESSMGLDLGVIQCLEDMDSQSVCPSLSMPFSPSTALGAWIRRASLPRTLDSTAS